MRDQLVLEPLLAGAAAGVAAGAGVLEPLDESLELPPESLDELPPESLDGVVPVELGVLLDDDFELDLRLSVL